MASAKKKLELGDVYERAYFPFFDNFLSNYREVY